MAFSALIRTLERSQLSAELRSKLQQQRMLHLNGLPRLAKGLVASALAQGSQQNLVVVTATVEEAGRWAAQLEAMGWQAVHFYPTTESSPYGENSLESETIWGQMQGLAEICTPRLKRSSEGLGVGSELGKMAIVCTTQALQLHLPSPAEFIAQCLTLRIGDESDVEAIGIRSSATSRDGGTMESAGRYYRYFSSCSGVTNSIGMVWG